MRLQKEKETEDLDHEKFALGAILQLNLFRLKETRKSFGLSQEQLGRVLSASWISISRWERGISNPPPEAEEKLRRLAELLEHLGGLIAPADLPQFLLTPNPAMQNFPPYDLLQSGYSFQKLIELVEKTKSGEFS